MSSNKRAKRGEISYKNSVAYCKANAMVCLHRYKIGSIDFSNSGTKCRHLPTLRLLLAFSYCLVAAFFSFTLGIGRKEGTDEVVEQAICKAFEVRLHPLLETLQMAYVLSDFIKQNRINNQISKSSNARHKVALYCLRP